MSESKAPKTRSTGKYKYMKKSSAPKTSTYSSSPKITDYFEPDEEEPVKKYPEIAIYTDGSTVENGKINAKGGYGVFFKNGDPRNIGEPFFLFPITNNRCELYGCIQGLQILARTEDIKTKKRVIVYTDSEYIVNCMTKWLPAWKARGWRKADGKPVDNKDMLYCLDKLVHLYSVFFDIKFVHINAAHDHNAPADKESEAWHHWHGNNEADVLAKRGTAISVKLDSMQGGGD